MAVAKPGFFLAIVVQLRTFYIVIQGADSDKQVRHLLIGLTRLDTLSVMLLTKVSFTRYANSNVFITEIITANKNKHHEQRQTKPSW